MPDRRTSDDVPSYQRATIRTGPVPKSAKLLLGVGALPGSHKDWAFNTFLLLYYSQVLGLPASWTSIVLAVALVFDAITDPLMGAYSDNFRSRLGRRHPFMYAAALPLGLCLFALFAPPAGSSQGFLLGWLLAFTLLTRLAFTLFVVPWNALAPEYSDDYVERTSIVIYRFAVGWAGGIAFIVAMYNLVFVPSADYVAGQLDPANYFPFAVTLGVVTTFWVLLTTHGTRRDIPYLRQPTQPTPRIRFKALFSQIWMAMHSSNFRLLFIATLLFAAVAGVGGVFDSYMNIFFWEFTAAQLSWFTLTISGAVVAFITVPTLQKRFEKQHVLVAALVGTMLMGIIKVMFRFLEIWPDNGDPLLLPMLVTHVAVVAFLLSTAGIMFASMMADLVDEQELATGARQEGVFSSAIGFSSKATTSLGLLIGGLLLDQVIGFPSGRQPGEIAGDILFRLALIDGVIIPSLLMVPIYILSRYSLTRIRLEQIQTELKAQKRS